MRTMIDPAADAVWDAVVTESTPDGIVEIRPETDGDWTRLRRQAVLLAESANLLLVEGRRVAAPESRSELPGIDLHPDAIEDLLADDWRTWAEAARALGRYQRRGPCCRRRRARRRRACSRPGPSSTWRASAATPSTGTPGHADPRPAPP